MTKRVQVRLHDKYGCINYIPDNYPDGESETTQEYKKKVLKEKYKHNNDDEIADLMKVTYLSQRKAILEKKMEIQNLQIEWPYLFEVTGMFVHFKELTDIKIKEKIEAAVNSKGERIMKWMEEETVKQIRGIRQELVEAKLSLDNGNPEVMAMICAIMAHLHEKEEFLYICVKVCCVQLICDHDTVPYWVKA